MQVKKARCFLNDLHDSGPAGKEALGGTTLIDPGSTAEVLTGLNLLPNLEKYGRRGSS